MIKLDTHYTPVWLAQKLLEIGIPTEPEVIADFAAGQGDLLECAVNIWPNSHIIATDINKTSIQKIKRIHPDWSVGCCDFLNYRSMLSCKVLQRWKSKISLLLLNPPFSCRGATRHKVNYDQRDVECGTALAFLLNGLSLMAPTGHVLAIMPAGSFLSERDSQAWGWVKVKYHVKLIAESGPSTFPNCSSSVHLIRLKPRKHHLSSPPKLLNFRPKSSELDNFSIRIIRGNYQLHSHQSVKSGSVLIHSTDLRNFVVSLNGKVGNGNSRQIQGSAVLIPRVGRMTQEKIALLHTKELVILSDCVFALCCPDKDSAILLHRTLLKHWSQLKKQYIGTGAPFITVRRLKDFLLRLGANLI